MGVAAAVAVAAVDGERRSGTIGGAVNAVVVKSHEVGKVLVIHSRWALQGPMNGDFL